MYYYMYQDTIYINLDVMSFIKNIIFSCDFKSASANSDIFYHSPWLVTQWECNH